MLVPLLVFNVVRLWMAARPGPALPAWADTASSAWALLTLPLVVVVMWRWVPFAARVVDDNAELARRQGKEDESRMTVQKTKAVIQAVLDAGRGLRIVYQPIFNLATRTVVGFEALSRFADDRAPDEWFEEAHSVGLGVELEMLAITRAIDEFTGDDGLYLSLNASPAALLAPGLLAGLQGRVPGPHLVVELTEHDVVEDYPAMSAVFARMHDLGIGVAIDDVGSGQSTLRHVIDLRPDIIKLDRGLVAHVDDDPPRMAMAKSLVQFAASVGCTIVAEGIETAGELGACRDLGVACGQGFLLGKPASAPSPHLSGSGPR
jgi:EAL domain-containing protein (putative c-di-GMP-specific phosphodiesterase class I)